MRAILYDGFPDELRERERSGRVVMSHFLTETVIAYLCSVYKIPLNCAFLSVFFCMHAIFNAEFF